MSISEPLSRTSQPSSSWQNLPLQDSDSYIERPAALGGLLILKTEDGVRLPPDKTATHQASSVWCFNSDQISLSIFDLGYAGPDLHVLPMQLTWPQHEHDLRNVDLELLDTRYDGTVCQCALHGDGYRIVLPVRCGPMGPVKGRLSLGWRKEQQYEYAFTLYLSSSCKSGGSPAKG